MNVRIITRQLAEAGVNLETLTRLTKEKGMDYIELGFSHGRVAGKMVDKGLLKKNGYKRKANGREVTCYIPGAQFAAWLDYYKSIKIMSSSKANNSIKAIA